MVARVGVKKKISDVSGLLAEWHPKKNGSLRPEDVNSAAKLRVWWRCRKDPAHEYQMLVELKKYGSCCPLCTGRRVDGPGSLAVEFPELLAQWHWQKNPGLDPARIKPRSGQKVWWRCSEGHEWRAGIQHRTCRGDGCPYCGGRRACPGKSLADLRPDLAAEWHPTSNSKTPAEVVPGGNVRAWWRCRTDIRHEWQALVSSRAKGCGCPYCAGQRVAPGWSLADVRPQVAAEWHPTRNRGKTPRDFTPSSGTKVWWQCSVFPGHVWRAAIYSRVRSGCPYCHRGHLLPRRADGKPPSGSLAARRPVVAAEWHPTKNDPLMAADVTAGSSRRIWWRCSDGHEWQARLISRTGKKGSGCPHCAGRAPPRLGQSLAGARPELVKEWDREKNGRRDPRRVHARATYAVWWRCSKNPSHSWRSKISLRRAGLGCPYCCGRRVVSPGYTLADRYPAVAAWWHATKNGGKTARDVLPMATYRAWWQCPTEATHIWRQPVIERTKSRTGACPFCAGRRLAPPLSAGAPPSNSLAVLRPQLASEWHPTKNGSLTPAGVTPATVRKAWWRCVHGHEWRAVIGSRATGCGCPVCYSLGGDPDNALSVKAPAIAAQWHPKKNGALVPARVFVRSRKRVWWKCWAGPDHEWQAGVFNRVAQDHGCPFCADKLVSVTNSLATLFSRIAREWHPKRNGRLTPAEVLAGSRQAVWWRCALGHVWRMRVADRAVKGLGCPACAAG